MSRMQPSNLAGFHRTAGVRPFRESRYFGRLFASQSFALFGAVILGVLVPEMFHPLVLERYGNHGTGILFGVEAAIPGCVLAIILGHGYLVRITSLPTISAKMYVLPTFLAAYAAVLAGLYMTNVLFGRYHFLVSLPIVVIWYLTVAMLRTRWTKTRVALVGDGPHEIVALAPALDWLVLSHPVLTDEVSAIVLDTRKHLGPDWEHFIAEAVLQGIPVHDVRYMLEILSHRVKFDHMADNTFGSLLPALGYLRMKRVIDLVTALAALPVAAPVIALCAIAIRLESKGPAFFSQQRTGFRGKPFTCYKLRSMRHGHNGPQFTHKDDVRITLIGGFVRKYRIDELPQILNVIKGDMSWIGPRPEAVELSKQYEEAIPYYVYRHAVSPGISGWAAVHQGNVADVDAATIKLEYDFFYIKYCSLWLDILIALKSIRTIATGFGSR